VRPGDVARQVERIREMAGDDEAAHSEEDGLHRKVLGAIAAGEAESPAECARIALTTNEINFHRWCA
jgi:hypothetical protein